MFRFLRLFSWSSNSLGYSKSKKDWGTLIAIRGQQPPWEVEWQRGHGCSPPQSKILCLPLSLATSLPIHPDLPPFLNFTMLLIYYHICSFLVLPDNPHCLAPGPHPCHPSQPLSGARLNCLLKMFLPFSVITDWHSCLFFCSSPGSFRLSNSLWLKSSWPSAKPQPRGAARLRESHQGSCGSSEKTKMAWQT